MTDPKTLKPGQVLNVTVTGIPATSETISLAEGGQTLAERFDKGLWNLFGKDSDAVREIWDQVQGNANALKACAGPHEFKPDPPGPPKLGVRFTCALCGGTAWADQVCWYLAGLDHGTQFGIGLERATRKAEEPEVQKRAYIAGHLKGTGHAGWYVETADDAELRSNAEKDADSWINDCKAGTDTFKRS